MPSNWLQIAAMARAFFDVTVKSWRAMIARLTKKRTAGEFSMASTSAPP